MKDLRKLLRGYGVGLLLTIVSLAGSGSAQPMGPGVGTADGAVIANSAPSAKETLRTKHTSSSTGDPAGASAATAPSGLEPTSSSASPVALSSSEPAPLDGSSLEQNLQQDGSIPAQRPGAVIGTILDQSGAVSVGTVVRLTPEDKTAYREIVSGDNGQFAFYNVPPGHFELSVSSSGFANAVFAGDVESGQSLLVPPIVLSVATVVTEVKVTETQEEVAREQVKEQETQRIFGFIPNFYVTYRKDAVPLTTKLKFQLAWKSTTDPVTIVGVAFLAGMQQAGDQYGEFGQGLKGYGKRFGAAYADVFAATFIGSAALPSLMKQDPRYFYQGTGSTKSRVLHAVGNSVMCNGDNGKYQVCYSNILGSFAAAALSTTYYPSKSGASVVLSNGAIRLAESGLAGVFQEFVAKRITKQKGRASTAHPDTPADDNTIESKK
jgi:hypothetical protein